MSSVVKRVYTYALVTTLQEETVFEKMLVQST